MEIKNQALLKMKEMAEKAKKNKTENELPKTFEISNPVVDINKSGKELAEFKPASLSLDLDEKVSKEVVMSNVKIPTRTLNASEEDILKAKRKVGRLTTGASAAVPLICRGPTCPFKAKCVDEDTLILTSFGFQPIKNLKPLDRIYSVNEEGLLEKDVINDVWKSGVKETFKIRTKYNLELTLTKDHPILTCDENYGRIYKTLEEGLSVGDVVFITDTDLEIMVDTLNYGDLYEDTIVSIEKAGLKEVYDLNNLANKLSEHTDFKNVWDIINQNPQRQKQIGFIISDMEYWAPTVETKIPTNLYYLPIANIPWQTIQRMTRNFLDSTKHYKQNIRRNILY